MKYRMGEKVILLDGRGTKYAEAFWSTAMDRYIGKVGVVAARHEVIDAIEVAIDGQRWICHTSFLAPLDLRYKPKPAPPLPLEKPYGIYITEKIPVLQNILRPKRIIRNGPATVVFWEDGSKTVVKRSPGDRQSEYTAFCAALAIKVFGSNSEVHRIVDKTEKQEK